MLKNDMVANFAMGHYVELMKKKYAKASKQSTARGGLKAKTTNKVQIRSKSLSIKKNPSMRCFQFTLWNN